MDSVPSRIRRTKLLQWALAYLAGAWLLLQVLDLVGSRFGWPDAAFRAAIALAGVGFLAALVAAWFHGERGEQKVTGIELAIFAVLCVLAGAAVALVNRGGEAASGEDFRASGERAEPGEAEASLAVLPFVNMSGDAEQEYFSDGVTEEILNALVRLPGLRVPGRTTSFSYKGRNLPIPEIARELRVAHVLEGSVRRDGDRLRITAQLVDARSDAHLWSETYDRRLEDVFAVQEEIATAIVDALRLRLGGAEEEAIVRRPTADLEAYNLYLRGRYLWLRRGADNLRSAIDHFERAVAHDADFALAWAALAETYVLLPQFADVPRAPANADARRAAERALELDPDLAQAHAALGMAHQFSGEWSEAGASLRRALDVDPRYAPGHHFYCVHLLGSGQPDEAVAECRRAVELDPVYLQGNRHLGWALRVAGRLDEAIAQLRHTLELDATFEDARAELAC